MKSPGLFYWLTRYKPCDRYGLISLPSSVRFLLKSQNSTIKINIRGRWPEICSVFFPCDTKTGNA